MSAEHRGQVLTLLAESFSIREPMAAALHAQPDDLLPFANALLYRCESEPFSYVAIERDSERIVGFSLSHDYVGPVLKFDAANGILQEPKPLFGLLADLRRLYLTSSRPRQGQVLEIAVYRRRRRYRRLCSRTRT